MMYSNKRKVSAVIVAILILIISYGLSWVITCGIIKLITLCFGFTFSRAIATGIWLILCLLSATFKTTVKR